MDIITYFYSDLSYNISKRDPRVALIVLGQLHLLSYTLVSIENMPLHA